MAQDVVKVEHRKARSGLDLAFLVLVTVLVLVLTSAEGGQLWAFQSPQSPLPPVGDKTHIVALPLVDSPSTEGGWLTSAGRARVAIALLGLGAAVVLGGLVWITNREAPATPKPSGDTGGHARQ